MKTALLTVWLLNIADVACTFVILQNGGPSWELNPLATELLRQDAYILPTFKLFGVGVLCCACWMLLGYCKDQMFLKYVEYLVVGVALVYFVVNCLHLLAIGAGYWYKHNAVQLFIG